MILTITNGVLSITDGGANPRNFFNYTADWQFSTDNTTMLINVNDGISPYTKTVGWANLVISGTSPSSVAQAKSLMNTLFAVSSSGGSGVQTVTGNLVNNADPANPIVSLPYLVYTALLTQSSTNAPVATVLQNTIGNIVWTRVGGGQYLGSLEGAFDITKTVCFLSQQNNGFQFEFGVGGINAVSLNSYRIVLDGSDIVGEAVDSAILNMGCQIFIYP